MLKILPKFVVGLSLALALNSHSVSAQQVLDIQENQTPQPQESVEIKTDLVEQAQAGSSVTVYVDAKFGRKKKGSAKAISKSHEKYFALGYRFVDLGVYTENGDLEGFFVTYTKN